MWEFYDTNIKHYFKVRLHIVFTHYPNSPLSSDLRSLHVRKSCENGIFYVSVQLQDYGNFKLSIGSFTRDAKLLLSGFSGF